MPRGTARGRMMPQSLSTDPRVGRLSLKAALLYDRLWINCDDQGRISGDPAEIKYATSPNIDHITKDDIPELLRELETQGLINVYSTSKTNAIQMLDWWEEQRLQWAYPSRYPPPEGWQDRLRYHASPTQIVTENWPSKSDSNSLPSKLPSALAKEPGRTKSKKVKSPRDPLPSPENKKEKENGKGNRRGRGNLPSALGSRSPPSLTADISQILKELTHCFKVEWGRVPAGEPDKVIRREPTAREAAQLRDLAKNLSAAGVPLGYIKQAFREAAAHQKCHISYVRVILLDWLGVPRGPPE